MDNKFSWPKKTISPRLGVQYDKYGLGAFDARKDNEKDI